jgi:hypothetical protein
MKINVRCPFCKTHQQQDVSEGFNVLRCNSHNDYGCKEDYGVSVDVRIEYKLYQLIDVTAICPVEEIK